MLRSVRVAFAFGVEKLRGIPGATWAERHSGLIATVLFVAAALVLGVWLTQRSPQRVSLGDLRAGVLAPLQRWIIVDGELESQGKPGRDYLYRLTDPNVASTQLLIFSETELPVGHTTISGNLIGGTSRAEPGFGWVGQLRADPILAREPDVPWLAIALFVGGVFILIATRTHYPVFFADRKPDAAGHALTLDIGVRPEDMAPSAADVPGTLIVEPGSRVSLTVGGQDSAPLRLFSARSSLEAGELRRMSGGEPALLLHIATGDVMLMFPTTTERDAAFGALVLHLRLSGLSS